MLDSFKTLMLIKLRDLHEKVSNRNYSKKEIVNLIKKTLDEIEANDTEIRRTPGRVEQYDERTL